jgi:hypothetical protein
MNFDTKYDHIIPIGSNCRIAIALRKHKLRNEAMPLDWMLSTMNAVNSLFDDDFKDFTNPDMCKTMTHNLGKSSHVYVLNEKYNLNITHEKIMDSKCIDKYNRRVGRMYDILNGNGKVLFIRNVLDGIVHDKLHKYYLSTEVGYLESSPDLIENFNSIIKKKFPNLKYEILVINHTEPIDFKSNNIFNITSSMPQGDRLWDEQACFEILKKLKIK